MREKKKKKTQRVKIWVGSFQVAVDHSASEGGPSHRPQPGTATLTPPTLSAGAGNLEVVLYLSMAVQPLIRSRSSAEMPRRGSYTLQTRYVFVRLSSFSPRLSICSSPPRSYRRAKRRQGQFRLFCVLFFIYLFFYSYLCSTASVIVRSKQRAAGNLPEVHTGHGCAKPGTSAQWTTAWQG